MKTKVIFLFLTIFLLSCSNEENQVDSCNVKNPLEDLEWLAQIKSNFNMIANDAVARITQYTYNNALVFLVEDCVNCSNKQQIVYNCSGTQICKFGGITGENTCPDFLDNATDKKVLYQNYNYVLINEDMYNNTETNSYTITSASISGDYLSVTIKSSGCNGSTWQATLVDSGIIAESNPIQRFLKIKLVNEEVCLAIVNREFVFNIKELKENEDLVTLNLAKWQSLLNY